MRVLVHIEPVWFRNDVNFLHGHFDLLIRPILRALSLPTQKLQLGISSNIILALQGADLGRGLSANAVDVRFFTSSVQDILREYGFSKSRYCRDIFSESGEGYSNDFLKQKFGNIVSNFRPDVVITTSKNRYLETVCDENSLPLVCCEMGPLPRLGFPGCRHISIGNHISSALKLAANCQDRDEADVVLDEILEKQDAAISNTSEAQLVSEFVADVKKKETVAILALQPSDWVTWEGALTGSFSPAEIVLAALEKMQSSRLIVLFHPDLSGKISSSVMTEIWLSDPRVVRAPAEIDTGLAELFVPLVDELLTVSSNLGVLAALYGKKLTALGKSMLSNLGGEYDFSVSSRSSRRQLACALYYNLHVPSDAFEDEKELRALLLNRLSASGFASVVSKFENSFDKKPKVARSFSENLDQIHSLIYANQSGFTHEELFSFFGRNALGYVVPPNSVGVELGVASGYFSESLLLSGNFQTLYSVDVWADHHNEEEYRNVCLRLGQFGDRSKIFRNTFDETLQSIPDKSLDFLYVDGYAHTGTNASIILKWLPKMKNGGIIAGHDFCEHSWPLNFDSICKALDSPQFEAIKKIEGVLTANTEDAIPSFMTKLNFSGHRAPKPISKEERSISKGLLAGRILKKLRSGVRNR